jgi:hypothetical protein
MYISVAEKRTNELWLSFPMCGCRTNLIFLLCTCLLLLNRRKQKEFSHNMELMRCSVFAVFVVTSQTTNKLFQKLNYKWKDNRGITD